MFSIIMHVIPNCPYGHKLYQNYLSLYCGFMLKVFIKGRRFLAHSVFSSFLNFSGMMSLMGFNPQTFDVRSDLSTN